MDADDALQPRSAFVDEIESHVGGARRRAVEVGRFRRQLDRRAGHRVLGDPGLPRHGFHAVAISVARNKIHVGIHVGGIGAQRLLDDAHRLDEFPPVHRAQEAQTADAIADGNLIGRLGLVVRPLQLLAGQALFGEPVLDPALDGRHRRALPLQPAAEFLDELVAERRLGLGHLRQHMEDRCRLFLHRRQQAAGPQVGQIPIAPPPGNVHRHAPQVLDQPQTQHDRHGPQFAERQRGDRLVGGDEVADVFRVYAPVHVGDQLQGDVINAGKPRRRSIQQTRQLAAVGPRQMQPRQADLLLDQIKVIQQPFASRGDAPALGLRAGHQIVGLNENLFVVRQPQQQPIRPVFRVDPMLSRQRDSMPAQLLAAEQLGAQGRLARSRAQTRLPGPPCLPM